MTDLPEFHPDAPRGIRNNNPGNIKASTSFVWRGQVGSDKDGFAVFRDPAWGLRAICLLFVHYEEYCHCLTLTDYLTRWAPPSENNTADYIEFMARRLSVGPLEPLPIHGLAIPILMAIVQFENGEQPYTTTEFQRAVTLSHER